MQLTSGYSHFMDLGRVLAQYDAEVRARPKARSGFEVERTGGVIRLTGHFNFICWWDLGPGGARETVAGQATYLRSRGEELIWRVYEHDKPAELGDCLAEEGFEAEPPGTLMVFDLANQLTAPIGPDIEIRRITTMEDLPGFMAASDVAFGREESWRFAAYSSCLGDPDLALYVALVSGKTVASARLEIGSSNFGLLFGGGVSPSYRRQGLYRALVAERAKEAKRLGCSYLIAAAETPDCEVTNGIVIKEPARNDNKALTNGLTDCGGRVRDSPGEKQLRLYRSLGISTSAER